MINHTSLAHVVDAYPNPNPRLRIIHFIKCFDQLDLIPVLNMIPDVGIPIRELNVIIMPEDWIGTGLWT